MARKRQPLATYPLYMRACARETTPIHVNYRTRWSTDKRKASPSQFRHNASRTSIADTVRLAKLAGRAMAKHLKQASIDKERPWSVRDLSKEQIDSWCRRYNVPRNRLNVMKAVAWARARACANRPQPVERGSIGEEAPRDAAAKMLAQYGVLADKMVRKLMRSTPGDANNLYWKAVARELRAQRKPAIIATTCKTQRGRLSAALRALYR